MTCSFGAHITTDQGHLGVRSGAAGQCSSQGDQAACGSVFSAFTSGELYTSGKVIFANNFFFISRLLVSFSNTNRKTRSVTQSRIVPPKIHFEHKGKRMVQFSVYRPSTVRSLQSLPASGAEQHHHSPGPWHEPFLPSPQQPQPRCP